MSASRTGPATERAVIVAALLAMALAAWAYLWLAGGAMAGGMAVAMPAPSPLAAVAFGFLMWSAMMVGMMLPSALPMILTFAAISRRRRARGESYVPTTVFTAGYLLIWGGFSLAATFAQWPLGAAGRVAPVWGATIFMLAGAYQLTPLKSACLRYCRSPIQFLLTRWREGEAGALRMGLEHGFVCLGCCWLLMALLFVGGAMNLIWAAAIAGFVLVEKLVPAGQWIARASGLALLGFGAYLLAAA